MSITIKSSMFATRTTKGKIFRVDLVEEQYNNAIENGEVIGEYL